jgi:hypothetical protein
MLGKGAEQGVGAKMEGDGVLRFVVAFGYFVKGAAHVGVYRKVAGVDRETAQS